MIDGYLEIGLLIYGYSLDEANFEDVVWGIKPHLLGRLPRAAQLIILFNPKLIIFGSGGTQRNGKKEAAWMKDILVERFYDLKEFSAFQGIPLSEETREKIEGAILDEGSKNTRQEARFAMDIFIQHGVNLAIIVSSPDHFMRAVRDALIVAGLKIKILAAHSDTSYGGSVEEVIIVEPRHKLHSLIKRLMQISPKDKNTIKRLENILNF